MPCAPVPCLQEGRFLRVAVPAVSGALFPAPPRAWEGVGKGEQQPRYKLCHLPHRSELAARPSSSFSSFLQVEVS